MSRRISLLELYERLPKKNCDECNFPTCMAFAAAILAGSARLEDCPHITEEDRVRIGELIAAPVAKLTFGTRKPLSIGGARVMHRHELKFYSPTAIAIQVTDAQSEEEIATEAKKFLELRVERLGETFGIDSVAITSSSGEAEPYAKAVSKIISTTSLPIILCCSSPEILESGLKACGDERPLIFAATKETLESYMKLAMDCQAPLTVANEDLGELRLMARKASDAGLDVALCPIASSLVKALQECITIRRAAIEHKIREFGHPIITVPPSLIKESKTLEESFWRESLVTSALLFRYADATILKHAEIEQILPIITLRHGVFSDPKIPAKVKPELYKLGKPGPDSAVLLTVNYALTYYLVSGDIDKAKIDCYLLVAETEGMSVLNALAGGQLKPQAVVDLIRQSNLNSIVSHRKIILPGLAARLRGEIEELSGWEILVGPVESRDIPPFLEKNWP